MAESYETVLKTLNANNLITLLDNSRPYDPPVKPSWWKEDHVCSYHRSKGHSTKNCFKLKDVIQDLIDKCKVIIDGLTKNADHKAFKQPLPEYDSGGTSKANKKNHAANISYAYADNVIGMLEPVEYLCMKSPTGNN